MRLLLKGREGFLKQERGPDIKKLQAFSLSLLEVMSTNLEPLMGAWLGQRRVSVVALKYSKFPFHFSFVVAASQGNPKGCHLPLSKGSP